ncbi:MAG: DUF3800 domain-containing protein [Candidatus Paceibacterota bacterium]
MSEKTKFFIFSDESGSWHDPSDIYVRAWIVITEEEYDGKLVGKVDEVADFIGASELKWSVLSGNEKHFDAFDNVSFRIFITVSCPGDIAWDSKYRLTRNFSRSIESFDFGEIDEGVVSYLKERIYRDLKNALFLHFYERHHIANAKQGIERVIKPTDYELIYRIDPPQMSHEGWRSLLSEIDASVMNIEFPKSNRSQGIQFADVIAGCVRSHLLQDKKRDVSKVFLGKIKNCLIPKNRENPNPNLIFFNEINEDIKTNCATIWSC